MKEVGDIFNQMFPTKTWTEWYCKVCGKTARHRKTILKHVKTKHD